MSLEPNIRSKNQPFYLSLSLSQHPPTQEFRDLLENYSKIPSNEINTHLEAVRDTAWTHHPYPSIGLFIFTDLGVSGSDLPPSPERTETQQTYQQILHKLKNENGVFLDTGCMFAQDTRKLVYDGVPPSSVYGTDLHGEYFEYGYELFRDRDVIPQDHFIACDILDEGDEGLRALEGKVDVLNAVHLIHVFPLSDQKLLLKRFMGLLKPEKGVMVTGRLMGNLEAGYQELANAKATVKGGQARIFEHNVESFQKMWREVGKETGTKWDCKAWFWRFGIHTGGQDKPENWHRKKEHGFISFAVTKLD